MRFLVAVTDGDWFEFVRGLRPDAVNFWKPGRTGFQALPPGAPFLFKLHARRGVPGPIVGGGFFVRYSRLPVSLAWDAFGGRNGPPDLPSLRARLERYWSSGQARRDDPEIGCCLLAEPFFLDERDWVQAPEDWAHNIVQGKLYDTAEAIGHRLWSDVEHHMRAYDRVAEEPGGMSIPHQMAAGRGCISDPQLIAIVGQRPRNVQQPIQQQALRRQRATKPTHRCPLA